MRLSLALSSLLCSFSTALEPSTYYDAYLKPSWNLINLQSAYDQGITGQGVTVGIVDGQFNTAHPSLQGKAIATYQNHYNFIHLPNMPSKDAFGGIQHGTHVAGIILGRNLDTPHQQYPHGIAHNGRFYAMASLNRWDYEESLWQSLSDKEIKIINNSWDMEMTFALINRRFDGGYKAISRDKRFEPISADAYLAFLQKPNYGIVRDLIRLSKERGMLAVVAAGNEGAITSGYLGAAAAYDESLRAWIVVGALDASSIQKDGDKITINAQAKGILHDGRPYADYYSSGIAYFSNLFRGTALYGITAPGMQIDSANALFNNQDAYIEQYHKGSKGDWTAMSGTSMATPMVSGAAMLVQEKFGFLSGAQIADVLLSTASYENVTLPDLIVQAYNGGALNNIIYINKDIPTDSSGKIDTAKVKEDLVKLGYTQEKAQKILSSLYRIAGRDSDAILKLEKYEVIGQGILNIQGALKGLGRLDANRLNLKDIAYFEGEDQAFYTIDTQGISGEFANDIAQRTWDAKWHIKDAKNSPAKQMQSITKVGLIKKGRGTLTLSGSKNSYEGATRVLEGKLEIAKGGNLMNSSAYAERSGATLSLSGEVMRNLGARNGGIALLHTGSRIGGSAIADQGGSIQVLGSSSARTAIAQNHGAITLGNTLDSTTLSTGSVYLTGKGILAGAGKIKMTGTPRAAFGAGNGTEGGLHNESGIVMAGFKTQSGVMDPTRNQLKVEGIYSHGKDATLQIAFGGGDKKNSQLVASSYHIQGGTLAFVSTYSGAGTLLRPKTEILLDLGTLKDHTTRFAKIETQDNNLLHFDYTHTRQSLTAQLKSQALRPTNQEDREVGEALRDIYTNAALDANYQDYFGKIAQADHTLYQRSVDSLAPNASLLIAKTTLKTTAQAMLRHTISALDFYTQSISLGQESKSRIFVDGNYALSAHSDAMGASLQYQNASKIGVLSAFANYQKIQASEEFAKLSSQQILLGMSGVYDLSLVSFLLSASGGVGINHSERSILAPDALSHRVQGDNKSYTLSAQAGLQRDIALASFVLRPMALIDYAGIFQEAYREKGGIFAKSYEKGLNHKLSALLGASLGYRMMLGQMNFFINAFGFYGIGILKSLDARSHFNDFAPSFRQSSELERHSFQGGVNLELSVAGFFTRLGVGGELGSREQWLNASLMLGGRF